MPPVGSAPGSTSTSPRIAPTRATARPGSRSPWWIAWPTRGRIERGAPADLVVLDYEAPGHVDAESFPGHWFFGLSAGDVRDVMVAGELVVADRRLTRVDQHKVAADAAEVAPRLWQRLEDIEPHPFEPKGVSRP